MQIVFKREIAELIRDRYTVVELETITRDAEEIELFCVLPAEKIAFMDLTELESDLNTHGELVAAVKAKDAEKCNNLIPILRGKFGGELDSFYSTVLARFSSE